MDSGPAAVFAHALSANSVFVHKYLGAMLPQVFRCKG